MLTDSTPTNVTTVLSAFSSQYVNDTCQMFVVRYVFFLLTAYTRAIASKLVILQSTSMPTFLPCLGHICRRRSRRVPTADTALPAAARGHQGTTKDSSSGVGETDSSVGGSLPAPLPVITDRGPPTAKNYGDPDIYWNSIMIEADEDEKARLVARPRRRGHTEARRSGLPDSAETSEHTDLDHVPESILVNGFSSSSTGSFSAQQRRHDNDHTRTHARHGTGQAGHDLTVMSASVPNYNNLPVPPVQPRRAPGRLVPGTRAWDDFWDPLEYTPRSRLPNPRQHHIIPEEPLPVSQPTGAVREEKDLPDVPSEHHTLTPPARQASRKTPSLTWNTCLNEILDHDNVDQDMADRVRERVGNSTTANGDGENEHVPVSTLEAGLVPNFSYPVAGSPFYDRVNAAQPPPPAVNRQVSNVAMSDAGVNSEVDRHTSTATNLSDRSLNFDFDLPNGATPSSPSSPLRSPTSSTSDSLYRAPTPPTTSATRLRLNTLLSEILTPSEVDLCNTVLRPPLNSAPRLAPLNTRLVLSLHRALVHLQDRVSHLEDSLLPQLGTSLEKKTYSIDVLSAEIRTLDNEISQLKLTLDFGNKILAGCWVREYEVWRTLLGIRERRRRKEWWRVWKTVKVENEEEMLSPDDGRQAWTGEKMKLSNGELEVLIEMAKQNVDVLREDVDDMVEKVERCRREAQPASTPQPEPGSWRDV